jgi:hypothetical protein
MAVSPATRRTILDVALFVASQAALFYAIKWAMDSVYPGKTEEIKAKQQEALKKLGHKKLKLDEYERE